MKAIIPAKRHSSRVRDKNWRPFYGEKSLVDLKIEQLLQCLPADAIHLSCDDPRMQAVADRYGIRFIGRAPHLASDDTPWPDAFLGMVEELPAGEEEPVAWVEVVNPLFQDYEALFRTWEAVQADHDSLVLVAPFNKFLLKGNGQPLNFLPGKWHAMSQSLEPLYAWDSACIMRKRDMRYFSYPIGRRPYLFRTADPCVDIDTPDDFRLAQILMEQKMNAYANPL